MSSQVPSRSHLTNAATNWNDFDAAIYHGQYEKILPEDAALTRAFIRAVRTHDELRNRLGTAATALDVAVGGVLRSAGLLEPFTRPDARIILADIGDTQLATTSNAIALGQKGDLGKWRKHEEDMAAVDPRWANAIGNACLKGEVRRFDIFSLPPAEYEVISTAFGPESLTSDPAEYRKSIRAWLRSGKPGAVAAMFYMINSTGYKVAGKEFPALAVSPADVQDSVSPHMLILEHFTTPASGGAREDHDHTTYGGMGMIIGIVYGDERPVQPAA